MSTGGKGPPSSAVSAVAGDFAYSGIIYRVVCEKEVLRDYVWR
jgi:hypothetical protein